MRELPDYIMEEVKLVLRYEAVAYVIRWNGRLRIVASLRGYLHAEDECLVATFRQEDVFTEDERTENYINANHRYPPWYKGRVTTPSSTPGQANCACPGGGWWTGSSCIVVNKSTKMIENREKLIKIEVFLPNWD